MTDMETTAFEIRVYYSQFPREEDMSHHAGPHGEVLGSVRRQKEQGKNMSTSLHCCFGGKKKAREVKHFRIC